MKSPIVRLAAAIFCAANVVTAATCVDAAARPEKIPSLDQLPAACRAAKSRFRVLTNADRRELETELADALARLDKRLEAAGENGADWRKYLQSDRLRAQLRDAETAGTAVLDAVYKRYTAGYEGLELVWFLDVRHSLRRYREMAPYVGDPAMQARYDVLLDFLAQRLEAYRSEPTAQEAAIIGQVVGQLEDFRQAPALVRAIRHHLLRPNLLLNVSADVVAAGIDRPIDRTVPVREVILGTDIYGTGHTTGQVRAQLFPDQTRGVIDAVFLGTVETRNVGYNGPVTIYSNGSTRLNARKQLRIAATGVVSLPTVSNAVSETRITGIRARRGSRLVERIAWKRSRKQKSQAECIASRLAERRVNEQIDQESAEMIGEANRAFAEKFRRPLLQRKLLPQEIRFSTTRAALNVEVLQADRSQLAAPAAPPQLPEQFDLAVRLHESMINNLATSALAGMTLHDEAFQAAMVEIFGELPEQLKADEDEQGWGITFYSRSSPAFVANRQQPISVAFAEDTFSVSVRGRKFYRDREPYPGMNVTATYRIAETDQGFKAVREGDLRVLPPDLERGPSRRLSAREQVIRTLLQKRFGKIFKKEIIGEGFLLPGKLSTAGKMQPVHLTCRDGWLTVAWKRTPPEHTPREHSVAQTRQNQRPPTPF